MESSRIYIIIPIRFYNRFQQGLFAGTFSKRCYRRVLFKRGVAAIVFLGFKKNRAYKIAVLN